MSEEIAQCPYCFGYESEILTSLLSVQVSCKTCFATGPHKHSRKEALLAWNQQSIDVQLARLKNLDDFNNQVRAVERAVFTHR